MEKMTSWRDSASEVEQNDLDGLLNTVLPAAKQLLEKYGEFFPFGAAVGSSGETKLLADAGHGDHPSSSDVLSALLENVRNQRDNLRAVAICSDVQTAESDAVKIELEHREGAAIAVVVPYKKKHFGQSYEYSALEAGSAGKRIWSAQ
jgi:hypothetical protein